jgi:pyruvate formate lyase activating enzyme
MKEALHYEKLQKGLVKCHLCPWECSIADTKSGVCGVRKNIDGVLYSTVYGRPCAMHVDPIEKKPLFHFLPGKKTFSIATVGCNFFCDFCQNWEISKGEFSIVDDNNDELSPKTVINNCKKENCSIISYTYTEPTIFYEYMFDIAKLAKKEGIKNTIVSNGYINEKPLRQLCKYLDGANIDLKSFSDDYYKKQCKGRLKPVLKTLKILKEEGVWLEITNLVVPGLNDSSIEIEKMCKWISKELGREVPLHFSRFHPDYKMTNLKPTPLETLKRCEEIAKKYLDNIYIGNIAEESNTYCPNCREIIISRNSMTTAKNKLKNGLCAKCRSHIDGVWI